MWREVCRIQEVFVYQCCNKMDSKFVCILITLNFLVLNQIIKLCSLIWCLKTLHIIEYYTVILVRINNETNEFLPH